MRYDDFIIDLRDTTNAMTSADYIKILEQRANIEEIILDWHTKKIDARKEKLITRWLIDHVFRNNDYYTLHDEETTNDLIWNLMEIIASLHNEYYKSIHGQYYDYMFHWVNKMNAGSIIDDIFKEFK